MEDTPAGFIVSVEDATCKKSHSKQKGDSMSPEYRSLLQTVALDQLLSMLC